MLTRVGLIILRGDRLEWERISEGNGSRTTDRAPTGQTPMVTEGAVAIRAQKGQTPMVTKGAASTVTEVQAPTVTVTEMNYEIFHHSYSNYYLSSYQV